ncbi:MAG: aminopeptidase P family protein [Clostridiaceae bacterium]|nr:aminopeptidase P family protein [Clostridiaceae bacterium]
MKTRIELFREKLREKEVDSALVTSWQNVFYLSGFTGFGDAFLFITQQAQYILTDSRYLVQAKEECPDFDIKNIPVSDYGKIAGFIQEQNVKYIGFEDNHISFLTYKKVTELCTNCSFAAIGGIIEDIRCIKSADEIEIVRKACDIVVETFNDVLGFIKEGVSEKEVAAEIEYGIRKRGADKTSFDTIVASGYRGALPHGTASDKVIKKGEAITMDFGAFYNGYCSDITRTVFLGEPDEKMREIYNVVLNANKKAIDSFETGMTGRDLDQIAREYISNAGYGDEFSHGLGHGVGVQVHEEPRITKYGDKELVEGMIFSIEPGIYVEGLGGVRIEDLATVVDGKLTVLTKNAPKEMIIL